jgi:hypothetical protein
VTPTSELLGRTYHDHDEACCAETVKELVTGDRDLANALVKEALQEVLGEGGVSQRKAIAAARETRRRIRGRFPSDRSFRCADSSFIG